MQSRGQRRDCYPFARLLACVCILLASVDCSYADVKERLALIIGNSAYKNAPTLENPVKDAQAIAKELKSIGFSVTEVDNADLGSMRQAIKFISQKASNSAIVLVYFAGHGVQINGKNYLIPIDASVEKANDLTFDSVDLDSIIESIEEPTHPTIIILDACRDNPFIKKLTSSSSSRSVAIGRGLSGDVALGSGTLIAYSTSPGNIALDGSDQNSPFAQALIKYIGTPGLEIRQMLTRVRATVVDITKGQQVPWDNSSLSDDVFLVQKTDTAIANRSQTDNNSKPYASANTQLDLADRVWLSTRDTQSVVILEDFIHQFPDTPYASMARKRIDELKLSTPPSKSPSAAQPIAAPNKETPQPTNSANEKTTKEAKLENPIETARRQLKSGNAESAVATMREFLKVNMNDAKALDAAMVLGDAEYRLKHYPEAAQMYLKIAQTGSSPLAPVSFLKLGDALLGMGQKTQACATFGEFYKRYPQTDGALKGRAETSKIAAGC